MPEKVVIDGHELWHGDAREVLPLLAPVDLVLTDPPYGIGADRKRNTPKDGWVDYGHEGWDKDRPSPWLFGLMREKAKECVVWGGNYFTDLLPPSMCWLVWDKGQRLLAGRLRVRLEQSAACGAGVDPAAWRSAAGRQGTPDAEAGAADGVVLGYAPEGQDRVRPVHGHRDNRRCLRAKWAQVHRD